jgi:hypothetical protein
MRTKKLLFTLVFAFALISFVGSCKKGLNTDAYDETVLSDDASKTLFDDAFDQADIYSDDAITKSVTTDSCAAGVNVVSHGGNYPRVITVDFGKNACLARNGKIRQGKIIINQSAPKFQAEATRTITFENYFVNGFRVEGTLKVAFGGKDENGHFFWTFTLNNGYITAPDGTVYTRDAEHVLTLIEGASTLNSWDNVWQKSGSATGMNGIGEIFTNTISMSNPIIRKTSCNFAVSGELTIELGSNPTVTLDYGNGACDNKATITVDGDSKEITLRKLFN